MAVIVFVGTQKGAVLMRADDARRNWEVGPLLFKGWKATAAARDAGGRTYVGVDSDVYDAVVMASDDLETWEQLEAAPRYAEGDVGNPDHNRMLGGGDPLGRYASSRRFVDQIWKLHAANGTVWAGVSEAGLFRTDDRGKSWQPVPGLNDHPDRESWVPGAGGLCAHTVITDSGNSQRMWVGISAAGVFRTDDGGTTWTSKNEGVSKSDGWCVHSLAHAPADAEVIYRQDHRGMYRTRDAGDSWQPIENGLPLATLGDDRRCVFGFPIEMDPRSGLVYAIPLEGDSHRIPHDGKLAVYRTGNGGESWERLARGLPQERQYASVLRGALAVDPLDPCGVYFGTTSGGVYASADRGDSWVAIPATLPKILAVEAFEV